jgi:4-aminobutyrate aminotransferase-like enzyme
MSRATPSQRVLGLLRQFESRNIVSVDPDGTWPIVWARAKGVNVWDADGKKYLDMTSAFGVAAAGHANAAVVKAGQRQMARLLHAMGDVHPHPLKAELARELSRITFERWSKNSSGKTIFCNSGFESVEAALKTAMLATGKRGIIAFEGAYHGLGYGALNATHRPYFRSPFREQLKQFAHFAPFPASLPEGQGSGLERLATQIRRLFRQYPIGAILVEPVQGRAGNRIPPPEFLPMLREVCDEHHALLIADEVFTGFGRTGRWFACEHTHTIPDLICLGKALSGGFPISACVGKAQIMDDAWPESTGEAIHTSTYLGHPVGCAMSLAQIAELEKRGLIEKSAAQGQTLLAALSALKSPSFKLGARGLGLMAALELDLPNGKPATAEAFAIVKGMLQRGYILLPEGEHGNIISFTPPLTITQAQLHQAVAALETLLNETY